MRVLGDVLGRREGGEVWPQTAGSRTVPGSVTEQGLTAAPSGCSHPPHGIGPLGGREAGGGAEG